MQGPKNRFDELPRFFQVALVVFFLIPIWSSFTLGSPLALLRTGQLVDGLAVAAFWALPLALCVALFLRTHLITFLFMSECAALLVHATVAGTNGTSSPGVALARGALVACVAVLGFAFLSRDVSMPFFSAKKRGFRGASRLRTNSSLRVSGGKVKDLAAEMEDCSLVGIALSVGAAGREAEAPFARGDQVKVVVRLEKAAHEVEGVIEWCVRDDLFYRAGFSTTNVTVMADVIRGVTLRAVPAYRAALARLTSTSALSRAAIAMWIGCFGGVAAIPACGSTDFSGSGKTAAGKSSPGKTKADAGADDDDDSGSSGKGSGGGGGGGGGGSGGATGKGSGSGSPNAKGTSGIAGDGGSQLGTDGEADGDAEVGLSSGGSGDKTDGSGDQITFSTEDGSGNAGSGSGSGSGLMVDIEDGEGDGSRYKFTTRIADMLPNATEPQKVKAYCLEGEIAVSAGGRCANMDRAGTFLGIDETNGRHYAQAWCSTTGPTHVFAQVVCYAAAKADQAKFTTRIADMPSNSTEAVKAQAKCLAGEIAISAGGRCANMDRAGTFIGIDKTTGLHFGQAFCGTTGSTHVYAQVVCLADSAANLARFTPRIGDMMPNATEPQMAHAECVAGEIMISSGGRCANMDRAGTFIGIDKTSGLHFAQAFCATTGSTHVFAQGVCYKE